MANCLQNGQISTSIFEDALEDFQTIENAANSEDLTTPSRTGGDVRTLQGRLTEIGGFLPINGGVWDSGISFTAYDQYMIFNGTAYKPISTTTLPYVSTAVPDTDFVEPFSVSTNASDIEVDFEAYNSTNLGGYTDLIFSSETTMLSGTTSGGNQVVFSEGQNLKIAAANGTVRMFTVIATPTGLPLGGGLYANEVYAQADSTVVFDTDVESPFSSLNQEFNGINTSLPTGYLDAATPASSNLNYAGSTVGATGNLYHFPYNAVDVLKFDPFDLTYSVIGSVASNQQYISGACAYNLSLYAASKAGTNILKIDRNENVTELAIVSGSNYGFEGAVAASNGFIYLVPALATRVARIDPATDTLSYIGSTYSILADKWAGGCLAGNGKIYCAPHNNPNILEIDPDSNTTRLIAVTSTTTSARWKGACIGNDGRIYFMPFNDDNILVFNPEDDSVAYVSDPTSVSTSKYAGCNVALDGKIYSIPYQSNQILQIDVQTLDVVIFDAPTLISNNKAIGASMLDNGEIRCCPSSDIASALVLRQPFGNTRWQISAYANKY